MLLGPWGRERLNKPATHQCSKVGAKSEPTRRHMGQFVLAQRSGRCRCRASVPGGGLNCGWRFGGNCTPPLPEPNPGPSTFIHPGILQMGLARTRCSPPQPGSSCPRGSGGRHNTTWDRAGSETNAPFALRECRRFWCLHWCWMVCSC